VPATADLKGDTPPGEAAAQHNGVKSNEGAAGAEPDLFGRGELAQKSGQFHLERTWKASVQTRSLLELFPQGIEDQRGIVTQNVRVMTLPEIDVLVSIQVADPAAGTGHVIDRVGFEEPEIVTPATDLILGGLLEVGA